MLLLIRYCSKFASYAEERLLLEVTVVALVDCKRLLLADDVEAIACGMLVGPGHCASSSAQRRGLQGRHTYPSKIAEIRTAGPRKAGNLGATPYVLREFPDVFLGGYELWCGELIVSPVEFS